MTRREFLSITITTCGVLIGEGLSKAQALEVHHIPVLMYHDISNHYRDNYTVSPSLFYAHMEYLHQMGYVSVFPEDLGRVDKDKRLFILTFDDGYASFMDYALPVLKDYGFKAIINVIGAYVGSYYNFQGNRPTLSWDDYRFLISSGIVRVGYHGYNLHVMDWVKKFTTEDLKVDALKFLDKLRKELGISTDIFAAPYGQYSEKHLAVLRNLGFKYIFTSEEKLYSGREKVIPRLNINHLVDLVSFKQYIGGGSV